MTHLAELGKASLEEGRAVVADHVADLAAVVVAFLGHVVDLLQVEEVRGGGKGCALELWS